mmetsp:Transcript_24709/g.76871  ORF Transcript_24709/g.76871 Transcript_24709/m.76871 type:complete len:219 (-) Transcript_24709:268-924(-)
MQARGHVGMRALQQGARPSLSRGPPIPTARAVPGLLPLPPRQGALRGAVPTTRAGPLLAAAGGRLQGGAVEIEVRDELPAPAPAEAHLNLLGVLEPCPELLGQARVVEPLFVAVPRDHGAIPEVRLPQDHYVVRAICHHHFHIIGGNFRLAPDDYNNTDTAILEVLDHLQHSLPAILARLFHLFAVACANVLSIYHAPPEVKLHQPLADRVIKHACAP